MSRLYVVSGPSGVGKSTVVAELLTHRPDIWLSVSATTRAPRPGEQDGREYFFLTGEEFAARAESGQMLEWAVVHGRASYGTPRRPVEEALELPESASGPQLERTLALLIDRTLARREVAEVILGVDDQQVDVAACHALLLARGALLPSARKPL